MLDSSWNLGVFKYQRDRETHQRSQEPLTQQHHPWTSLFLGRVLSCQCSCQGSPVCFEQKALTMWFFCRWFLQFLWTKLSLWPGGCEVIWQRETGWMKFWMAIPGEFGCISTCWGEGINSRIGGGVDLVRDFFSCWCLCLQLLCSTKCNLWRMWWDGIDINIIYSDSFEACCRF